MTDVLYRFETPVAVAMPPAEAVICVPTFRRPQMLERTLRSLAEQKTSIPFAVVVVENDAIGRDGAAAATRFLKNSAMRGAVEFEPQQGNVHAINRAFGTALARHEHARYFLMIDDDEIAAPDWLERMVSAARDQECDIVGGPVLPVFGYAPDSHRRHPVFQPAYAASGRVAMIYGSGNCLITRAAFERLGTPYLDPRFNFLGGGDTEFFTRAREAGLHFFWAQEAVVKEIVGSERVTPLWILQRGLRIGAINYQIDQLSATTGIARAKVLAKNAGVVGFAIYKAARLLVRGAPVLETLHPLVIAFGRWFALLGMYPEQYRAKPGRARA